MADNSTLPATGDVIRDKDRTGVKTQIIGLDLNPSGTESLMAGSMPIDWPKGLLDAFGHFVNGQVNSQIDIQWYRGDGTVGDLVAKTTANGGTAAATNGLATFSATTSASSQAKGVTNETTIYSANAEIFALFTAGFTGTGSGTSYHRIGLYDTNNGFFIGFEAGSFGIAVRKGASDTRVLKASFSEDPLTGGATSKFTRAGTPEAIDLTKLNVFRIRLGWVGSADIYWEVLSPDGVWVTFHITRQPNNAALPSINTADLPITCDVNSGNSATALTIITSCWSAGTSNWQMKLSNIPTTNSFASFVRAVLTGYTGSAFKNVLVSASGEVNVVNAGTFAVQDSQGITDNAGFTDGTTKLFVGGYIYDEVAGTALTENDAAAARINVNRAQVHILEDGATRGRYATVTASNALKVDNSGVTQPVSNAGTFAVQAAGDVAHGSSNSGNPLQLGCEAIAHGTNPTAVTAGQRTKLYANRAGIPFVMAGHPKIVTIEAAYTAAQTDTAIVTVSTGTIIVVTQVQILTDNANTAFPQCRVGFGTANTPTTTGVAATHPGIPAGGGVSRGDGSGIIGIGADNEDLRITCGAPTGGSLRVLVSYYTIES